MTVSGTQEGAITDVRDAIRLAKEYVKLVLSDEKYYDVGLEETEYDESDDHWKITIGFSRPWNTDGIYQQQAGVQIGILRPTGRSYKVVEIASDGKVLRMRNRYE